MTHVRAHYAEKPNQELVRLDSFEILHSPLAEPVDYARATLATMLRDRSQTPQLTGLGSFARVAILDPRMAFRRA